MMNRCLSACASLALALGLGTNARAGTVLFTPAATASPSEIPQCRLTNVSHTPVDVTVAALDGFTGADITNVNLCSGSLPAGASCLALAPAGSDAYCQFTASSPRVRGVLIVNGNNGPVYALPATK